MKQQASKPLIVMTPKSLLRLPHATSSLDDMTSGGFQPVIADPSDALQVERLILCSGKVYYDLRADLEQSPNDRVAVLRVEQFYPFPQGAIRAWLADHSAAKELVWLQEEPQNMGAWSFIRPRLEALLTGDQVLGYVGRSSSASPATGSYTIHQLEQKRLLSEALSLD
jgi:2-oxoglutarate dehydrogenase E1 component